MLNHCASVVFEIPVKLLIVSLQYSPVFKSESFALGKTAEKIGAPISYLFSKEYGWMLTKDELWKCNFVGRSKDVISTFFDSLNIINYIDIFKKIKKENPDVVYSSNFHPFFNPWILVLSKILKIKYIQHIHEPYTEDKSVYEFFHQFYLIIFELLQGFAIKASYNLILSSDEAEISFKKKFNERKIKFIRMPLLFENLIENITPKENRKFITFIGPPSKAKNFEKFVQISNCIAPLSCGYTFLLITREPLTEEQSAMSNKIAVHYKKQITDEEFFNLLSKSIVVVAPYRSVRQSSTVLTSYMCGTPVLTSDVEGFKEVVINNKTGIMMSNEDDAEAWASSIEKIINSFDYFSVNSRNEFLKKYSGENWNNYLNNLLNCERVHENL